MSDTNDVDEDFIRDTEEDFVQLILEEDGGWKTSQHG